MATVMPGPTMELDPIFVKALRLLHSRSKDSAAQLKKMVDEAIASRKIKKEKPPPDETSQSSNPNSKTCSGNKPDFDDIRKQEADKHPIKVKVEPGESSDQSSPDAKRPKLFDVLENIKKESDDKAIKKEEKSSKAEKPAKKKAKPISDSESNSEPELGMEMDDFAVGMGIACVVCRQFDVTNANQLVECQECHNLYHQECHAPKVDSFDLNDPRFVWYCSKCTKLMKKSVTKPPKTKSPQPVASAPTNNKEKEVANKSASTGNGSTTAAASKSESFTPFRRIENKSSKSDGAGSKPLAGLAGMAANLSGKSSEIKPGMRNSEIQKIQKANEAAKKALEMQQQLRDAKIDFSKATNEVKKKPVVIPKAGANKPVQPVAKVEKDKVQAGPSALAASADKRLQMMKKKTQAKMESKKLR